MRHKESKTDEELIEETIGHSADFINLDDEVNYKCNKCGTCCIGINNLLLHSFDVYNMCKELNEDVFEILKKYLTVYIGHNSLIPILRVNNKNDEKCLLLETNVEDLSCNCILSDNSKPGICRLNPFGIIRTRKVHSDNKDYEVKFIYDKKCNSSCNSDTKIIPREYLKSYLDEIKTYDASLDYDLDFKRFFNEDKLRLLLNECEDFNVFEKDDLEKTHQYIDKYFNKQESVFVKILIKKPDIFLNDIYKSYVMSFMESHHIFDFNKTFDEQLDLLKQIELFCIFRFTVTLAFFGVNILKDEFTINDIYDLVDFDLLDNFPNINASDLKKDFDRNYERKIKIMNGLYEKYIKENGGQDNE